MNLIEAARVLEAAYPLQGVTVTQTPKGTYKVTTAAGEQLGCALDLTAALRQAVTPVLEAEHKRVTEENAFRQKIALAFQTFLMEKFNAEFTEYCKSKAEAAVAAGQPAGPSPDPKLLVSLVP